MSKRMLIDAVHPEETRVVIVDGKEIVDFDFVTSAKKQIKGNIYLAKVTRVEPSLQAAFVEYGGGKQGFLPLAEIHYDYYQIPAADRKRLMDEIAAEEDSKTPPEETTGAGEATALDDNEAEKNASDNSEQASSAEDIALPELKEIETLPDSDESTEALDAAVESVSEEVQPDLLETAEERKEEAQEASGDDVETIADEEEEVRLERKRRSFFRRYKIQEVIKRGQIVLVQVIKEERGNKGASLTTYLSLAGRYCVLMPNSPKDGGISRKIASPEDRKRLKAISTELRLAEGMSVIIRTAGMERPRAEIKRDFDYLVKLWNHIRQMTLNSSAPALIYEESDVIKRAIRDQYKNDVEDIIIQGAEGYETAREFMKILLPSHTSKVRLHSEPTPLFYAYEIEDQLMSMHDPVVKLKSGGYLVMNPTEALIAIDVNSGRSTAERNIEETAFKTNMEAAAELGRQLRLRDLAGLIVIDFIDMLEARNRRAVEKALKDVLKADRAKIQLGRISPFGLLEMSRQRLRPSIAETTMVPCIHCEGRGYVRSNESMSIQIIRALEKEAATGNWGSLRLLAPQAVVMYLLNSKRDILRMLEEKYDIIIQILIDAELVASEFNLEKMRRSMQPRGGKRRQRADRSNLVDADAIAAEVAEGDDEVVEEEDNSDDASRRNRSRRGRRGGKGRTNNKPPRRDDRKDDNNVAENSPPVSENDTNADDNTDDSGDDKEKRSRGGRTRRGGRGRRRSPAGANKTSDDAESTDTTSHHEPVSHKDHASSQGNVVEMKEKGAQEAKLPEFTQRPAKVEIPQPQQQVANLHGNTERDPNAPVRKGWWQRMINLDD